MAKPLATSKKAVNLARTSGTVSRVRRDPPPPTKPLVIRHRREGDGRMVILGIIGFALALFLILFGLASSGILTLDRYTISFDI
jgi:hypothetical protein